MTGEWLKRIILTYRLSLGRLAQSCTTLKASYSGVASSSQLPGVMLRKEKLIIDPPHGGTGTGAPDVIVAWLMEY